MDSHLDIANLRICFFFSSLVGDQFPSAEVLGVDLSPIQPNWIPPNVRFVVDDVESPWLYPRDHFDYIHSRHTVMAIKNWPRLLRRSLEYDLNAACPMEAHN